MSLKEAAKELLKLADDIEKEASELTQFVCSGCNHTASLSSINGKRSEAAKAAGENVTVSPLTVEDKIHCPACEGIMAYSETEESKSYYIDTEKKAQDADEDADKDKDKKASEPIDYDSLKRYST